jgi:hypothetical protein
MKRVGLSARSGAFSRGDGHGEHLPRTVRCPTRPAAPAGEAKAGFERRNTGTKTPWSSEPISRASILIRYRRHLHRGTLQITARRSDPGARISGLPGRSQYGDFSRSIPFQARPRHRRGQLHRRCSGNPCTASGAVRHLGQEDPRQPRWQTVTGRTGELCDLTGCLAPVPEKEDDRAESCS